MIDLNGISYPNVYVNWTSTQNGSHGSLNAFRPFPMPSLLMENPTDLSSPQGESEKVTRSLRIFLFYVWKSSISIFSMNPISLNWVSVLKLVQKTQRFPAYCLPMTILFLSKLTMLVASKLNQYSAFSAPPLAN